jgi:hypothetical protein
MRLTRSVALIALGSLATAAFSQISTAAPTGTRAFNGTGHSSVPGCPDLAWRLVRKGGDVTGVTFYADLSGVSMVKGTVNDAGQFRLVLTPSMGEGPSGTVTGVRTRNGTVVADMKGTGCANMHISMKPSTDISHWTNFGGGGNG